MKQTDIDILEYIGVGHDSAVTRSELAALTGYPDRKIRSLIQDARERELIINIGEGYFIPDLNDDIDVCLASAYRNSEQARAKSIMKAVVLADRKMHEAGC